MTEKKRIITAEEAKKILQKMGGLENKNIIVEDKIWLTGAYPNNIRLNVTFKADIVLSGTFEGVWLDGTFKNNVFLNGTFKHDVMLIGNFKNDVYLTGTYKKNVRIEGSFNGKTYTNQRDIATIATMAKHGTIISLKDFRGEK
ncbi:hypothetical protein L6248_01095 [Candidatus Parcubacteria bacterium]|nr:hypothetical protein [Candidatus Parcubacteria bacterium]MCG2701444.1 hypothetical protein [Candidatus Parcubacteria bacterium]